jgi:drug/metabolite transporter (DMT)-like permease
VVIGRTLAKDGLGGPTVLSIRFGLGSLVLLAILAARRHTLVPMHGERIPAFLLGAVGYAIESSFFFLGLERGTAAAVTLVFYAYPAALVLLELAFGLSRPDRRLLAAMTLSIAGVAIVVGTRGELDISRAGIAFALCASVSFALYLLASERLVRRTDPAVNAAWVSGGASLSLLVRGLVTGGLHSPAGHWPLLLGNGLANAAAFGLMFAALRRVGATRTAVVMTFEAFAAAMMAAVFLDESLGVGQVIGGVAIVAGAALVATQRGQAVAEAETALP